ncbi:MAG: hypothetical protein IKP24_03520 [Alphaproteobacteria bacterium]|nr:hypothetical protein [Alphaproteobacteria bacterium]
MIDINKKFARLIEDKKREDENRSRKQKKQEQYARLVESFMNIHQIEKTGLCQDFVAQYYENKTQELGEQKVKSLKSAAAEYIRALQSSGQIYEHISWFRFVLDRISR